MIKDYKNDVENFKLIEYEAAMNQVNMEFDKALSGSHASSVSIQSIY